MWSSDLLTPYCYTCRVFLYSGLGIAIESREDSRSAIHLGLRLQVFGARLFNEFELISPEFGRFHQVSIRDTANLESFHRQLASTTQHRACPRNEMGYFVAIRAQNTEPDRNIIMPGFLAMQAQ
jgi:hypothetical protein